MLQENFETFYSKDDTRMGGLQDNRHIWSYVSYLKHAHAVVGMGSEYPIQIHYSRCIGVSENCIKKRLASRKIYMIHCDHPVTSERFNNVLVDPLIYSILNLILRTMHVIHVLLHWITAPKFIRSQKFIFAIVFLNNNNNMNIRIRQKKYD